jgi:hypothetical protein
MTLWGCLEAIRALLICARARPDSLVSWEEVAEESYQGQPAREASDDRPASSAIPGLRQWSEQLLELQGAYPDEARRWSPLPAWAVVCEVLGLFHQSLKKMGADRHWAQYWLLLRPDLAAYRCTDADLEVMIAAIRADLRGPNKHFSVPELLEAAAPVAQVSPNGQGGGGARVVPKPRASVNARMLQTIQEDPDAMGWSCKQWAQHLRCAKSSVVETATWKNMSITRERARAERRRDRGRRPKASDHRRDD